MSKREAIATKPGINIQKLKKFLSQADVRLNAHRTGAFVHFANNGAEFVVDESTKKGSRRLTQREIILRAMLWHPQVFNDGEAEELVRLAMNAESRAQRGITKMTREKKKKSGKVLHRRRR